MILKHHKKTDGTYNPKISISYNRTTAYMPTCIYTSLVRFKRGAKSGTVTDGEIEDSLNAQVRDIRRIVGLNEEVVESCETAKQLVEYIIRYNERKNLDIDIVDFARKYLETVTKLTTRDSLTTGVNSLCHYLLATTGKTKLSIKALTSRFLLKYEKWLRSTRTVIIRGHEKVLKPLGDTGVNYYMITIQTMLNHAKRTYNDYEMGDIVIKGDPFKAYKIPEISRPAKRSIAREDILKVFNYMPPKKGRVDELARDMFVMSFMMAGMNAADFCDCSTLKDGRIEYHRCKTRDRKQGGRAFISIPIIPEVAALIEKYRDPTGMKVFRFHLDYPYPKCTSIPGIKDNRKGYGDRETPILLS